MWLGVMIQPGPVSWAFTSLAGAPNTPYTVLLVGVSVAWRPALHDDLTLLNERWVGFAFSLICVNLSKRSLGLRLPLLLGMKGKSSREMVPFM